MYHYVYKIKNLVNGKIYVGKHSTNDLDDGYMGSGKLIAKAIAKHGIENFQKEIIKMFSSSEEAFEFEHNFVNEEFIIRTDTYNLIVGGDGFFAINSNENLRKAKNRKAALAMNIITWADPEFRKRKSAALIAQTKKLFAEGKLVAPDWTGKFHSEESKVKIGLANSLHQRGEKNSQFGTIWITNDVEKCSKRINKNEIDDYVKLGWRRGRKMKW